MDKKWKTERMIELNLPWDCGAPQLAAFPEKLVDVKEPIWKKPEGMTFEDVKELKSGEVGILAHVASVDGEPIAVTTAESARLSRALGSVISNLKPGDQETLLALLKDLAKKRAGRQ